jgi:predicted PhzF superfamily epimerase YddE/YHI9
MSSITPTPRSYPFAIANAFTQDAFGGNPAAIVFLDPSNTLTQEERLKFAKGFNQPVVVFLTPTSTPTDKPGAVASFDVQYFGPSCELEVCGHGAIAAIKIILDSATNSPGFGEGSQFPTFSSPETHTVEFIAAKGTVVSARKVVIPHEASGKEEEWFEIVLPAGKLENLPVEEAERVLGIFNRAVGKEPKVKYIGIGEPPFQHDLLIVLDEDENIDQLKLDAKVLVSR